MEAQPCFACSNTNFSYLANIPDLKSKHSQTTVPELLKIICGGEDFTLPTSDDVGYGDTDQSVICIDCLDKINDYDAACILKERTEREFRDALQRRRESHKSVESMNLLEVKIENIEQIVENSLNYEYTSYSEEKADGWSQSFVCSEFSDHNENLKSEFHTQTGQRHSRTRGRPALKKNAADGDAEKKLRLPKLPSENRINAKTKGKPLKCPICGIVVDDEESLREHKALHDGKSALQCITCDQFFNSKGTLVRHTRIHIGNKTYQCERCGKSFMHHSSLQMHIKAHEDIREKQCPHCPNQFRSTSHLNRHLRIHTGAKPYACPKCQQRFAQRYNMTVHLRLHDSSEKSRAQLKHVCTICESAFARPSKLAEHYSRAHETMMPHANGNDVIIVKES